MKLGELYRKQIRVARAFGIPVHIDYRWFIIFALSVWLVATYFEHGLVFNVRVSSATAWFIGGIITFLFFLSVFGHELSHALVGRAEGIEIEEIVLHPFGGYARLSREPDSPRAEFRVAVAGPAASFIFALVGYGAMRIAELSHFWTAWAVFAIVSFGNLLLAVFNLLPGYPLDGGRVMRAFLWQRTGRLEEATRTVSYGGQLIAGTLVVFGIYIAVMWHHDVFMAFWSIIVGLFLWDASRSAGRGYNIRAARQTVADVMATPFAIEPDTLVSHFIDAVLPLHRQRAVPVAHARRLHGILTLEDLKPLPRERWHRTRVSDVMRPVSPLLFVGPATPLLRAEELMKQNGTNALAVINTAGELIGFLQRGQLKKRSAN